MSRGVHRMPKNRTNTAFLLLAGGFAVLVLGASLLSWSVRGFGPVEPSPGAVAAAAKADEACDVLATRGDYESYALAVRVAEAAYIDLVVRNSADAEMRAQLTQALEALRAAREAWQADIDGAWAPGTYGSPSYWRALHPAIDLGLPAGGTLTAGEVRAAALDFARARCLAASELAGE